MFNFSSNNLTTILQQLEISTSIEAAKQLYKNIKHHKLQTFNDLKSISASSSIAVVNQPRHLFRKSTIKDLLKRQYEVPNEELETFFNIADEIARFSDFDGKSYVIKNRSCYNDFLQDVFFYCRENSRDDEKCSRFIQKILLTKVMQTISVDSGGQTKESLLKIGNHRVLPKWQPSLKTKLAKFMPSSLDVGHFPLNKIDLEINCDIFQIPVVKALDRGGEFVRLFEDLYLDNLFDIFKMERRLESNSSDNKLRPSVHLLQFGPIQYKLMMFSEGFMEEAQSEEALLGKLMEYMVFTESSQAFVLMPTSFVGVKINCGRSAKDQSKFLVEYGVTRETDKPVNFLSFLLGWIQKFESEPLTTEEFQEFKKINQIKSPYLKDEAEGSVYQAASTSKSLP